MFEGRALECRIQCQWWCGSVTRPAAAARMRPRLVRQLQDSTTDRDGIASGWRRERLRQSDPDTWPLLIGADFPTLRLGRGGTKFLSQDAFEIGDGCPCNFDRSGAGGVVPRGLLGA